MNQLCHIFTMFSVADDWIVTGRPYHDVVLPRKIHTRQVMRVCLYVVSARGWCLERKTIVAATIVLYMTLLLLLLARLNTLSLNI